MSEHRYYKMLRNKSFYANEPKEPAIDYFMGQIVKVTNQQTIKDLENDPGVEDVTAQVQKGKIGVPGVTPVVKRGPGRPPKLKT